MQAPQALRDGISLANQRGSGRKMRHWAPAFVSLTRTSSAVAALPKPSSTTAP